MMRKLLHISAILALLLVAPVSASAGVSYEAGVLEYQDIEPTITYTQGVLYINGAEGKTLESSRWAMWSVRYPSANGLGSFPHLQF